MIIEVPRCPAPGGGGGARRAGAAAGRVRAAGGAGEGPRQRPEGRGARVVRRVDQVRRSLRGELPGGFGGEPRFF